MTPCLPGMLAEATAACLPSAQQSTTQMQGHALPNHSCLAAKSAVPSDRDTAFFQCEYPCSAASCVMDGLRAHIITWCACMLRWQKSLGSIAW